MTKRECIFCEQPIRLVGWVSVEPVYAHMGGGKQCKDLPSFALPDEQRAIKDAKARPARGKV